MCRYQKFKTLQRNNFSLIFNTNVPTWFRYSSGKYDNVGTCPLLNWSFYSQNYIYNIQLSFNICIVLNLPVFFNYSIVENGNEMKWSFPYPRKMKMVFSLDFFGGSIFGLLLNLWAMAVGTHFIKAIEKLSSRPCCSRFPSKMFNRLRWWSAFVQTFSCSNN